MRKIAAHRIVLLDGNVLHRSVVEVDDAFNVISSHPLTFEEPFVEFFHGEISLASLKYKSN